MNEALILGCSDRKRGFSGPAILVYDGPLWKIVRNSLPRVDLFCLSALHGLIRADQRIQPYDLTLAKSSLDVPQLGNQWLDLGLNSYNNIYTCMGQDYALLLGKVAANYSRTGRIFRIGQPGDGIGQLGQALRKWCRQNQGDVPNWIGLCLKDG
ncbi:MAG: hypothetical protein BroJett011_76020 [Chloroflexota bacterium]|nr:MAG: hypothetical protein BroJett011_76020 [Chloroflexota bacterium]